MGTEYLLSKGRRKILFLGYDLDFDFSRKRLLGYKKAMELAGLSDEIHYEILPERSVKCAMDRVEKLLQDKFDYDAVFGCVDYYAIGAMNALIKHGYQVPEQVSILGFDGSDMGKLSIKELTAVAQPKQALGKAVVEYLMRLIRKEKIQEKADLNIDEDEYNQTTFSYTTVYKDSFDDVEKTAKNITEAYEKDNDFDAAVATEGLTAESVTFTTKKPEYKEIGLGKTIIKNSLKLKDGECSSYEDKDGNIVILYMKAVKDESESNSKKSELENQKKSDYYNDTIKKLKKDTKIKVDEDAWDSIKVSKKEIYTSMKDADNDADDTSNESNDSSNKAVIGGDDSSIDVDVTASDGGATNAEITSREGDSQEDKDGESDKATDDKNIAEQDDSETK